MNISGVLVSTYPKNIASIEKTLLALDGVEVHGNNEDGRIVITVEQADTGSITDTVLHIQNVPGVLSASMIYHEIEE